MKVHYFEQEKADEDDGILNMAKAQGYVPCACLLGGNTVMGLVLSGHNPCSGCKCDRAKCKSDFKS